MHKEPILYIDDDEINLVVFKDSLDEWYQVFTTTDTVKGLDLLASQNIKVVVTDQRMPGLTGIELSKLIKEQFPEVVCIILTGNAELELALEAINSGSVYRFLLKPWNIMELSAAIADALEKYNLRDENSRLIHRLQQKNKELSAYANELTNAYDALAASEKMFSNIFYLNHDAISITDLESGVLVDVNASFERIFGYAVEQVKGMVTTDLVWISKNDRDDAIEQIKEMGQIVHKELQMKTQDGRKIWCDLSATQLQSNNHNYLISVMHDISEKKESEKRVLHAIIEAEEQERSRFSRELHDGLGPTISTIKLYFECLLSKIPSDKNLPLIRSGVAISQEAMDMLKEISNNISPRVIKGYGLTAAVKNFVGRLNIESSYKVDLNSNLDERLDLNLEITCYRVITELINNTLKHALAKHIAIDVVKQLDELHIEYMDDGVGFVKENIETLKGLGLFNIRNRIETLGGCIEIFSKPNKGIQVQITLKLND